MQSMEQEKILANYLADKKLISKMYFNLQFNPNGLVTNEQETWTGIFPVKIYRWPASAIKSAHCHGHKQNPGQIHSEIPPDTSWDSNYKKDKSLKSAV